MRYWLPFLVTACFCVPVSAQSTNDPLVAESGSYVVARGRLKECMSWNNRIVAIERVPAGSHTIDLLGLLTLDVRGMTSAEIETAFLDAYHTKLPERPLPPFKVEIASSISESLATQAIISFRRMVDRSCPTSIPPLDQPPKLESHEDYWYLVELQDLRSQVEQAR